MWWCVVVVVMVWCGRCGGGVVGRAYSGQVVVISLDGFGQHYLDKYPGHFLPKMYSRGVYPIKFRNQFTTKTFPNHFSTATGVYENVHGVVGNDVYDVAEGEVLTIRNASLFTQNPNLIPIWTLNELVGGISGCIMWPGCAVTYRQQNLTFYEPYHPNADLRREMERVVQWLTHPHTPASLILVYHDQPDVIGHVYGPNSPQVMEELVKIDSALEYLFHLLEINKMDQTVDVVVMSDHGMMSVRESDIIDITALLDTSQFFFTGTSPLLNIWPRKGANELEIYKAIEEIQVQNHFHLLQARESKSWHYEDNTRISGITLLADDHFVFDDFTEFVESFKRKGYQNLTSSHGEHGYPTTSPNMEPIFVALGPSFRRGFVAPAFSNIDVYPLLALMLSLPPGPNNGSLTEIQQVLNREVADRIVRTVVIALVSIVVLVGMVGLVACTLTRRAHSQKRTRSADTLINGYVYRKTMGRDKVDDDKSEEECLLDADVEDV